MLLDVHEALLVWLNYWHGDIRELRRFLKCFQAKKLLKVVVLALLGDFSVARYFTST